MKQMKKTLFRSHPRILLLMLAICLVPFYATSDTFTLDVDGDGKTEPLTDGLLIIRHLFGFTGGALTNGAIASDAPRTSPTEIQARLDGNLSLLDIDDDGSATALTDGLLIIRSLFGFSGEAMVIDAVAETGRRFTATSVEAYIASIRDTDSDGVVDSVDAFPSNASESLDTDLDGIGNNADSDDDGDGVMDDQDPAPLDPLIYEADADFDGDGVQDSQDPAPLDPSVYDDSSYGVADFDGDGVINLYDADDDGDGLIDALDTDPVQASIDDPLPIMPWLNEIKIRLGDDGTLIDVMSVEVAKISATDCNLITVKVFDEQGGPLTREGSAQAGLVVGEVVGNYRGETGCDDVWLVNDYDFVKVEFANGSDFDRFDLTRANGIILEFDGKCIDVVSFGSGVRPAGIECQQANYSELPEGLEITEAYTWARAGVGVAGADFGVWYKDDRNASISSGWTPYQNNYQMLRWSAPESLPRVDATEFGVLEIPRPRNSVVKSLQDSGWSYPPMNGTTLKVHQVSEVLDEHLEDDNQSDYVFASDKIRPDFLEFLDFMLGTYTGFMGSVRAENYMHHFDYSSEVLNELAFQRGNYDAKSCHEENGGPEFFSAGSGGGYSGMAEESYLNDKLYFCYRNPAGKSQEVVGMPRRNFDASYANGYDWPDNILSVGSEIDLGAQSEPSYGGTRPGKFRDELMGGHMHEWSHNWESFHTIVGSEFGPMRFSHPIKDWAGNPAITHAPSVPFELYVREYLIHDEDFDGTEKLWSLKKLDERDIVNDEFAGVDYLTEFRNGNQGVEQVWVAYLIKRYGLEKLYSEYYRRTASSGDYRVAFHQTYGKPLDQLLQDAAQWASTVRTHEDFRLLFDSADEFKANLNQSFNVSLLQARNGSTPNNRYQTLYTYVGEDEPDGVGTTWIPVAATSGESLVFSENVVSTITHSESGQLQINGYDAYFYQGDISVFHAGGLAVSGEWSGFTRRGERTSDLWFPVFIYDHDDDGLPDDYDPDYQAIYFTEDGRYKLDVWPDDPAYTAPGQVATGRLFDSDGDGIDDRLDDLALNPYESVDTDGDWIGNNVDTDDDGDGVTDALDFDPLDPLETIDTDLDGIGNYADTDDDGDGILDAQDPASLNPAIFDQSTYNLADLDGDGIVNLYDADDDGDGLLDVLDANASESSVDEARQVVPWINGLKLSVPDWAGGREELLVEMAVSVHYQCNSQTQVTFFDETGNHVASEAIWPLNCDSNDLSADRSWNGYHFFSASLWAPEASGGWLKLPTGGSIALSREDVCIEVVALGGGPITPASGPCEDVPALTETEALAVDQWHERSGIGAMPNDFLNWYVYPDSGYLSTHSNLNHYQRVIWSAPESIIPSKTTELAVLDLPKPRSTKIKGLQDSGWSKPPRNDDRLKVFAVSEINAEVLADDGESSYVFASPYLRSDYLDYLDYALGGFVAIMGSPRATNLAHHFDYSEASQVLTELAFQRGHLDAKSCWKNEFQKTFAFAGQGGGYHGMHEQDLTNSGSVSISFCGDDGETHAFMAPLKVNDPSWGQNQDHPEDLMTNGSTIDLSQPSYPCCGSSSFREGELFKWLHEFTHNWEAQHTIAVNRIGPKRFATPRPDWEDNPIMHGPSTMLELYYLDNILDEAAYDGGQNIHSTREQIENRIRDGWPDQSVDYVQKFAEGDQGFEGDFSNYLIRQFGLEKLYSEYYRRKASSGDYRIALHQTYGKTHRELFVDADAWMKRIEKADDYRLFFDSAEEFLAAFNPSFNVSFLQARNDSTPNARYQTLYTFLGDGVPDGVGSTWVGVEFSGSESLALHEGVEVEVSSSEAGQLQINGHNAYFYTEDSSVFHAGGLAVTEDWSAFTRYGERTSDLWFPVFIYDHDSDGLPDDYDPDFQSLYFTEKGQYRHDVWPGDEGFEQLGQESQTAF